MKVGLLFWLLKSSLVLAVVNLSEATKHMEEGDFAKAYCIIRPHAEQGNAQAQYLLGWMYHNGYGLKVNDNETLKWWSKAAEQNYLDADYSIALMYELGSGVRKDAFKALEYYLNVAREGHEDSIQALKYMLNNKKVFDHLLTISIKEYDLFSPQYRVRVKHANIRNGPSLNNKIVAVLKKGISVVVVEKTKSWSKIILRGKGQTAWVSSDLLEKISSEWVNK